MSTVIQLKGKLKTLLEIADNLELTRQVEILIFLNKIEELDKDVALILDKENNGYKVKGISERGRLRVKTMKYPATIPISNYVSTLKSLMELDLKVATI